MIVSRKLRQFRYMHVKSVLFPHMTNDTKNLLESADKYNILKHRIRPWFFVRLFYRKEVLHLLIDSMY
jgi:hypothetical protein